MGHQPMTPGRSRGGGSGSRHPSLSPALDPQRKSRVSHRPLGHGRSDGRRSGGVGGYDTKPRSRKKPDCFITTACAEARGLPDDCEQLRVLRAFRDGYVADLPDGAEVLAEYDEKAPRIVAAIRELPPALAEAVWAWIFEQIEAAVELIGAWRFDSAYRLYAEACMELEELILNNAYPTTDDPQDDPQEGPAAARSAGEPRTTETPSRKETKVEA